MKWKMPLSTIKPHPKSYCAPILKSISSYSYFKTQSCFLPVKQNIKQLEPTSFHSWYHEISVTTPPTLFVIPCVFTCSVSRQSGRSVGWMCNSGRNFLWLLVQPKDSSVSKLYHRVFSGVSPPLPLLCLPKIPGLQAWQEAYGGVCLCVPVTGQRQVNTMSVLLSHSSCMFQSYHDTVQSELNVMVVQHLELW